MTTHQLPEIAKKAERLLIDIEQAVRGKALKNFKRHGKSKTLTFSRWRSMRARCLLPNTKSYPIYGGRGIKIHESWMYFENFLADMGECPSKHHTLDRIDHNGNYEAKNCRWATRTEQNRN